MTENPRELRGEAILALGNQIYRMDASTYRVDKSPFTGLKRGAMAARKVAEDLIEVYTDGACLPVNPGGTATYGYEIRQNGRRVHEDYGVVGKGDNMSNNVGEYKAVQKAAEWLITKRLDSEDVVFRSDSRLVVSQLKGDWKVHKGLYIEYYGRAINAVRKLRHARFEWVPRERNEYADTLTERAYREYLRTH